MRNKESHFQYTQKAKNKFLVLILFSIASIAQAQSDGGLVRYKTSAIIGLGTNLYMGDVCKSCQNIGYQASFSSRILIYKKLYFRPEFTLQRIQSKIDHNTQLSFANNTWGIHTNLEYALTSNKSKQDKRANNEFFISLAPSLIHHNPFASVQKEKTYLAPLFTENRSYSKLIFGLKAGIFADFKISNSKRLGIALDYTLLMSDYIDDVSGNYIDYKKTSLVRSYAIDPSQKATIESARGNDKKFDSLLKLTFSYELNFERKEKTL